MQTTATLRYLRISPRKVRLVVNLIKGMPVEEAESQLNFSPKRSAEPILKLLKSAAANAKHRQGLEKKDLYIYRFFVNEGPTLKRWRPRAFGRAFPIMKRTSHMTIILDEIKPSGAGSLTRSIISGRASLEAGNKRNVLKKEPGQKEEIAKIAKEFKKPRPIKKEKWLNRKRFVDIGKKMFRRKSI